MTIGVTVRSDTDDLQALGTDLRYLRPALDAAADEARARIDARFRRGIRPPVTPAWAARKGPRPVLVFRGVLRASLTSPHARYARETMRRDSVSLTTTDPVAVLHARGVRGVKRLPVSISDPDRRAVSQAFRKALLRGLR